METIVDSVGKNPIALAFLASFCAGMATGVGALGVVLIRRLSRWLEDTLLSTAAGIMLAATIFSLLLPGIDYAEAQLHNKTLAVLLVIGGLWIGALLLWSLDRFVPHEHLHTGLEGVSTERLARIWLFVFAITLHNLPEGMAVGVGMMQADLAAGVSLAVGIGLQNIPEGLAVAVSLITVGYSRGIALLIGAASGLVEPLGGLFAATIVWFIQPLLALFLGVAGGAMLYVISDEIIPETHRQRTGSHATFALLAGFALMMFLDVVLG